MVLHTAVVRKRLLKVQGFSTPVIPLTTFKLGDRISKYSKARHFCLSDEQAELKPRADRGQANKIREGKQRGKENRCCRS